MARLQELDEEPSKLDVYARPFIPQNLKAVNDAPADIISCAPARWIDFDAYCRTFAGSNFLTANLTTDQWSHSAREKTPNDYLDATPSTIAGSPPTDMAEMKILRPNTYEAFFGAALEVECSALRQECEDHALFRVPLVKSFATTDPRPSMYR